MKEAALLLPLRPAELHVRGGAIGLGSKKVANAVHVSSRNEATSLAVRRRYELFTTLVTTQRCLPIMRSRTKPSCS